MDVEEIGTSPEGEEQYAVIAEREDS